MSAPSDCYRRHDDVVTREILGETLLVPISSELADMDNIFALNETGAFIWSQLDGETTLESIRDALARTFAVEAGPAWDHLQSLVAELEGEGLAARVTPP